MTVTYAKQTIRSFLDAMAARDVDMLRSLLREDAVWWVPPSIEDRIDRPLVGREPIVQLASGRTLNSFKPGSTSWDIKHLTEEGDFLAAHIERRAVTSSGRPYHSEYHLLFRFADRLVAEVWEIMDTAGALKQLVP